MKATSFSSFLCLVVCVISSFNNEGVTLAWKFSRFQTYHPNRVSISNEWSKSVKSVLTSTLSTFLIITSPNIAHSSNAAITGTYPMIQSAETQTIELFENVAPSVVYINTFVERLDAFSMNVFEVPRGTGSGFVWDNDGHIVTNYHVIRDSASAKVIFTKANGKSVSYKAEVTGVDPDKDVAVLKIDAKNLKPLQVGDSSGLRVGQAALAIGNPFGLDHTLTTGIVSGLGREMKGPSNRPLTNLIQTDAAINPGNSGGPLLDSSGRLIGMNTAIYSTSGGSAGIGFAIPVDTLKYEVDTLIREGKVVRPALGIKYLESSQAKALGIVRGILVLDAPQGSPAQQAGVRSTLRNQRTGTIVLGDIVVGINNDMISSESDLFRSVEKYKVGDEVVLKVVRRSDWRQQDEENSVNGYGGKDYVANRMKNKLSVTDKDSTTTTTTTKSPFEEDDGEEEGDSTTSTSSMKSQQQQQNQQQQKGKNSGLAPANEFIIVELKVKLASASEALGSSS